MAFPKGSPLTPFFKHFYIKMMQSGTLHRLKEKWKQKDKSSSCVDNSYKPTKVGTIASLIVLILIGAILALFVLFVEKYLAWKQNRPVFIKTKRSRVTQQFLRTDQQRLK